MRNGKISRINDCLLLWVSLIATPALGQSAGDLVGQWRDADNPGKRIAFAELSDGTFEGRAVSTPGRVGVIVFRAMAWNAPTTTYRGTLIDPDTGQTFAVVLTPTDRGTLTFVVRKFFLKKTFRLVRTN